MATTAEKLANNMNFGALGKATELRNRLLFTLGALIVFRLGTFLPIPGINPLALQQFFEQQSSGILGVFDTFSGGALGRMGIFALGVMPYISASIIMTLMQSSIPYLKSLKEQGSKGRRQIIQYSRYLTVLIAALQGYGVAVGLESMQTNYGNIVINPGLFFKMTTVVTLVGGTVFLMWLGEQISSRGVGNGISLIITAGIIANLPNAIVSTLQLGRTGELSVAFILAILILILGLIIFIIFVEKAQRRLLVQYPKRQVGNKVYGGQSSHLPLKINTAGVIPVIFASSILLLPNTMSGFGAGSSNEMFLMISSYLGRGQPLYMLFFAFMIIFFAFFYTGIVFNPDEQAENLRKYGGFIPGIRPGENTSAYIDYVLTRLTTVGAIYLTLVALLPEYLISKTSIPFYLGGTSLLIVVVVMIDFIAQVQSHLFQHQYEGLLKKTKLKGRVKIPGA
ncbi:MAG: Protein translocase subunit SecY [Alphaproteobacteria bacterium MarineAlpha5_Bin8]|nr:MAG: Protein translocase subunit SecY [Alphaproteobacteria bacterium MarineAlpha5_Bin7]PPR48095.1 MAG: Protein translocase subunit SecY [Alphaproteobacteria bacterium MarineAlpha5_Bin8]PPR54026.1 MAG: Protein translocase subunit SecY [Alphaproteobacteria bacterium MarineAlpha5_Bin6]|tara:strand:+ start:2284 stop:3639 length:1356 start_codon:yes stop_codon:yes gene_type:complete